MNKRLVLLAAVLGSLLLGCGEPPPPPVVEGLTAFVGARVFDGTRNPPVENAVLLVRDGKVEGVGQSDGMQIPAGATRVDLAGKAVMPGIINAHGHVGGTRGLESGPEVYTEENVLSQLRLYARYGVTTIASMGGDGPEAVSLRDAQAGDLALERARIFPAGKVVDAATPDAARAQVDENVAMGATFIKIRVDDFLGTRKKMEPEVYQAVIEHAHQKGLPVAAHLYYLDDAKLLIRSNVDFIAHSIRDKAVDDELIQLLKERNVCVCPTLTREVSTFVYEGVPEFFADPFFTQHADPQVIEQLKDPKRQQSVQRDKSAQQYKKAFEMAKTNLKKLVDSGVKIAFGTDSGPPARFQGYFEHLELEMMADAGLTPEQILVSAAADAAGCLGLKGLGTLERGNWADFIVLGQDPLADIKNSRTIESVWIAGHRLP